MVVVNMIGPPGSGKSTGAAYIFSRLKMEGINAELVTEFAKDKTWGEDFKALECQEYVFGKQSYRLFKLRDKVEVAVTDSPLILSVIYNNSNYLGNTFNELVCNVFNSYDNMNFYINRVKPYISDGRNQTEEVSNMIGDKILNYLTENCIPYSFYDGEKSNYDAIYDKVFTRVMDLRTYEEII